MGNGHCSHGPTPEYKGPDIKLVIQLIKDPIEIQRLSQTKRHIGTLVLSQSSRIEQKVAKTGSKQIHKKSTFGRISIKSTAIDNNLFPKKLLTAIHESNDGTFELTSDSHRSGPSRFFSPKRNHRHPVHPANHSWAHSHFFRVILFTAKRL